MGEDPGEIRKEIEVTRDRMSVTADALAHKANLRERATEKATAKKNALVGRVRRAAPTNRKDAVQRATAAKQRLVSKARGVVANPRQAREQSVATARRTANAVRRKPQAVASSGLAMLLGLAAFRRARKSAGRPVSGRTTVKRARGGQSRDTA